MIGELVVRFLIGVALVSLFACTGELFKPKSFAGLFGAAPSVAIASLGLAYVHHDSVYVATSARSMFLGALGLFAYAASSVGLISRGAKVWLGTALAIGLWFAIALWAEEGRRLGARAPIRVRRPRQCRRRPGLPSLGSRDRRPLPRISGDPPGQPDPREAARWTPASRPRREGRAARRARPRRLRPDRARARERRRAAGAHAFGGAGRVGGAGRGALGAGRRSPSLTSREGSGMRPPCGICSRGRRSTSPKGIVSTSGASSGNGT